MSRLIIITGTSRGIGLNLPELAYTQQNTYLTISIDYPILIMT